MADVSSTTMAGGAGLPSGLPAHAADEATAAAAAAADAAAANTNTFITETLLKMCVSRAVLPDAWRLTRMHLLHCVF